MATTPTTSSVRTLCPSLVRFSCALSMASWSSSHCRGGRGCLVVWHVLTDAASPYAAIGGLVGVQVPNIVLVVLTVSFALEHMALEVYHFPRIFKPAAHQVLYQFPWLKHCQATRRSGPGREACRQAARTARLDVRPSGVAVRSGPNKRTTPGSLSIRSKLRRRRSSVICSVCEIILKG